MKKIGLLALAIVLALGALGVGYAAWTDTIFINGTVNTGTLGIDIEYVSGTDIYKDLSNDSTVVVFWLESAAGVPKWSSGTPPASNYKVASAAATVTGDDTVEITFTDAYPSESLCADMIIHCTGSVPVKVDADIESTDPKLLWLYENGYVTFQAKWVDISDPVGGPFVYDPDGDVTELPVQMHYCDYIKVWMYLDLPQADADFGDTGWGQEDFMNLQGLTFTANIYAIQWNEYAPGWWIAP